MQNHSASTAPSPTGHPQGGDEDRHCPSPLHAWTAARRVFFSADVNEPHPRAAVLPLSLPTPVFVPSTSSLFCSAGHLLLPCPSCWVGSHQCPKLKHVLPVPSAALQGWGATGPSRWGCTWEGERVLRGAQTSDPEDHRDPSLWDPISRLSLETHLFPHTELSRCLRGTIASSPPARRYVGTGPSESCWFVMSLGPCHHPASLGDGQARQDYDS